MATMTAIGGPDKVEATALSTVVVLVIVVASERLIGLLALAVSIIAVQFEYLMDWVGTIVTAIRGGCNFVVLGVQNIISFLFFS